MGAVSPVAEEDFASLQVEEIVAYLRNWQAPRDPIGPSSEGLAQTLKNLVGSGPARFAENASQFKGLSPTYVRALLTGFNEAVKADLAFPWAPVLDLCKWVSAQPESAQPSDDEDEEGGHSWRWTRKQIADVLCEGFQAKEAGIPIEYGSLVWSALKPLTADSDPTPEYETTYSGNWGPATASINSTRGQAMHAVVRYALWVRRHLKETAEDSEVAHQSLADMPEVKEVLDYHLDIHNDRSVAIRSVYGQWFPWLVLIDKEWAVHNRRRIFPADEALRDLSDAAWSTYIKFCAPYDNVLELLHDQYRQAVERITQTASNTKEIPAFDVRLSEHLLTFYGRGQLELTDVQGLLARFYQVAPDPLIGHAMEFVGRGLRNTDDVPPVILERFRALWEARLEVVRSNASECSFIEELVYFGEWFASGEFDDDWAIYQLEQALNVTKRAEPDRLVIEHLASLAPRMPARAVRCLRLMVEGAEEFWRVNTWGENPRAILGEALRSQDDVVRQEAEELVNQLGARGYLKFRSLLSHSNS